MNKKQEIKVSLGCGRTEKPGWIGLDHIDFGWNKLWDATKDQIPLADDSVDYLEADNFIEHIERKYWKQLFNECHRVLKPNGTFQITVPNADKDINIAMADPTHVSLWVNGTLMYLTGERPRNADYGFKRWIVIVSTEHPKDKRVSFIQLRPNK